MKIKMERLSPGGFGGGSDGTKETQVVEWPEDTDLPFGAVKVADSTPVHDWKPEPKAKAEGK